MKRRLGTPLFQILDEADTIDLTHFPQPTWQRKSAIPVLQNNTKIATQHIFAQNPFNKVVKNSLNKRNEDKNSRDTMISCRAALHEHEYTLNEKFSHIHSYPPSSSPSSQPFLDNPALEAAEIFSQRNNQFFFICSFFLFSFICLSVFI